MKCGRCALSEVSKHVCVGGDGPNTDVDILFVGESLGAVENQKGRCFVGPTGTLLRSSVRSICSILSTKIGRDPRIRYTNAIRCFPGKLTKLAALRPCKPHLIDEIKSVKPKRIITLGALALESVVGERLSIMDHVEGWTRLDFGYGQIPVQFLVHPSSPIYNPSYRVEWRNELKRTIVKKPPSTFSLHSEVDVCVVSSVSEALGYIKSFYDAEVLGFDTEYNDKTGRLLCAAFSCGDNHGVCFLDGVLKHKKVRIALKKLFENAECDFAAHNWKFDAHVVCSAFGISYKTFTDIDRYWYDTAAMRKITNAEQKASLECAEYMVGLGGHKGRLYDLLGRSRNGNAYEKAYDSDPGTVAWYCALDAVATRRLKILYEARMRAFGIWPAWRDVFGPLGPVLFYMESVGFPIDRSAMRALDARITDLASVELELIRSSDAVNSLVKHKVIDSSDDFNPRSSYHMRDLMFNKHGLGLKPVKQTEKGTDSTDVHVRDAYMSSNDVIANVAEYIRLEKLRGTYVKGWKKLLDEDDIIHTTFTQNPARTGRLRCRRPNLQTIPRAVDEETTMLRRLLVPLHDDEFIMEVDFSQAELRQLAMESGDAELIRCFRDRIDVHIRTASEMMGCSIDEVTKDDRRKSKPINFGVIYGMGDAGLKSYAKSSYGIEMSIDEARKYRASYFRLYSGVRAYQMRLVSKARRTGIVNVNWCGEPVRYRPVPNASSNDKVKAGAARRIILNTPIQGGAMEYTSRLLIACFRSMRKGSLSGVRDMILTVHDSVWFRVERDRVNDAFSNIGEIAVSLPTIRGVPLEVEAKAGPSAGDMKVVGVLNSLDVCKKKKKECSFGKKRVS